MARRRISVRRLSKRTPGRVSFRWYREGVGTFLRIVASGEEKRAPAAIAAIERMEFLRLNHREHRGHGEKAKD